MISKKYLIILIILFGIVLSLSFLFTQETFIQIIKLGITGPSPIKIETDVVTATESSVQDKEKVLFDLSKENTCYWLRSTKNATNYLLEINEYEYFPDMKGCFGVPKDVIYIVVDHPLNLKGISCLCNDNAYQFEWKNGLKIIKTKITTTTTTVPFGMPKPI